MNTYGVSDPNQDKLRKFKESDQNTAFNQFAQAGDGADDDLTDFEDMSNESVQLSEEEIDALMVKTPAQVYEMCNKYAREIKEYDLGSPNTPEAMEHQDIGALIEYYVSNKKDLTEEDVQQIMDGVNDVIEAFNSKADELKKYFDDSKEQA